MDSGSCAIIHFHVLLLCPARSRVNCTLWNCLCQRIVGFPPTRFFSSAFFFSFYIPISLKSCPEVLAFSLVLTDFVLSFNFCKPENSYEVISAVSGGTLPWISSKWWLLSSGKLMDALIIFKCLQTYSMRRLMCAMFGIMRRKESWYWRCLEGQRKGKPEKGYNQNKAGAARGWGLGAGAAGAHWALGQMDENGASATFSLCEWKQ